VYTGETIVEREWIIATAAVEDSTGNGRLSRKKKINVGSVHIFIYIYIYIAAAVWS